MLEYLDKLTIDEVVSEVEMENVRELLRSTAQDVKNQRGRLLQIRLASVSSNSQH